MRNYTFDLIIISFSLFGFKSCSFNKEVSPKEESYWEFNGKKYVAQVVTFNNFFNNSDLIADTKCYDLTNECIASQKRDDSTISIDFPTKEKITKTTTFEVIPGDYAFQNKNQCSFHMSSPEFLPSLGKSGDKITVTVDKNGKLTATFNSIWLGWPNKRQIQISGVIIEN